MIPVDSKSSSRKVGEDSQPVKPNHSIRAILVEAYKVIPRTNLRVEDEVPASYFPASQT